METFVGYRKGTACAFSSPEDMSAYIANEKIEIVDACFCDPLGCWHHMSLAPNICDKDDLTNGWAFDGSSIRLFKTIEESDMLIRADVSTCFVDPFMKHKVLHVTCDVLNADGSPFNRCSRTILKEVNQYVEGLGICTDIVVGPEVEFFVFENVTYECNMERQHFEVQSKEQYTNMGRSDVIKSLDLGAPNMLRNEVNNNFPIGGMNHGQYMLKKQYYAPTVPIDQYCNLRGDMLLSMESLGIPIEKHHHEVACAQQELGITCSTMLETADNVMTYKYVVKNVANFSGKTVTFMPKPMAGDNGSGMHCHFSLWKDSENIFYDKSPDSYQNLSATALNFIAGVLKHTPALLAFCCPTVNSYKRLTPGYEAPSMLSFSAGNRSAAVRIPIVSKDNWRAKRMEYRCPDPTANPYLAISAIVLAGVDGIVNKLEAPKPLDRDTLALETNKLKKTPASLSLALDALEEDCDFLLVGKGGFCKSFITSYISYKRAEYRNITNVPTPMEYMYYYAC